MQHQTLQDKYPHLEVSVLKLSEVKKDNESFRIDSEYLRQEYLYLKNILLQKPYEYLSQLVSYNSRYSQPIYDDKSKMKVINSQYIRNEFIDYENAKTGYGKVVPKESVLINSTGIGTLGRVNINLLDFDFSIDSHINVLVIKDRAILNPYFLMIFLQTKYGQSQINRYYSGTSGQIEIYPKDFNYFIIPIFPMSFQLEIERLVKDSHKALESSKALYKEAEALLYEALGLDSKNPLQSILNTSCKSLNKYLNMDCYKFDKLNSRNDEAVSPNTTIATLKESFLKTGRLDAEYYQSKYEDIERFIKNYKGGYGIVSDFFTQNKNICDFSKPYYNYIEIGDINTSNGNINYNKIATNELPANAKIMVRKGDILISKVRPYRGAIGIVNVEKDNLIASGAFVVLQEKGSIKKEFLQVLLRTSVYKEWVLRYNVGTSYPVIKDEDILNLPIPLFDSTTQAQIATYIQKSFELRAEAKKLLESAKAEVESALNNANNGGGGVKPS